MRAPPAAWALPLALAVAMAGCIQAATRDEDGIDEPTGPCADHARDVADAFLLVQVRRVDTDDGADLGAVAGLEVNITKSDRLLATLTTGPDGCVVFRLEGEGFYHARAAVGDGPCRARGVAGGATDAQHHLELVMRLQDPCA